MKLPDPGHQRGDEGKPANEKLWHAIVMQARARFAKYPSPAAASWVHQTYKEKGGRFIQRKRQR